jgi:hypothetical protein
MGGDLCVFFRGRTRGGGANPCGEECRAGELSGKRASTCAPATGTISDVCATPISASPLAT